MWGKATRDQRGTERTNSVVRLPFEMVPMAWTRLVWADIAASRTTATCLDVAWPLPARLGSRGPAAQRQVLCLAPIKDKGSNRHTGGCACVKAGKEPGALACTSPRQCH